MFTDRPHYPLAIGAGLGFALAAITGFVVLLVVGNTLDTTNAACHALFSVNHEITSYFQAQASRIGQPGTPNYHYYLTHPHALEQARQAYDALIAHFAPAAC